MLDRVWSRLKDLFYLISDFISYIISVLASDRRIRIRAAVGTVGAVLAVCIIAALMKHEPAPEKEPDPESYQVMEITPVPTPTVTPAPRLAEGSALSTAGGITIVNEYVAKKNAQNTAGSPVSENGMQTAAQTEAAQAGGNDLQEEASLSGASPDEEAEPEE